MRRRTITCTTLITALLASAATLTTDGAETIQHDKDEGCAVCGMYIHVYEDTATRLEFDNNDQMMCCGVACALRSINEHLGLEHAPTAYGKDWTTKDPVPLREATLLVGSDTVPDMVPNYIAFASEEEARDFQAEHGGQIVPLDDALSSISYHGMTMPFRVVPAATPPSRVFAVASAGSYMRMDQLMKGSSDISTAQTVADRGMAPVKMETWRWVQKVAYAFTDDLVTTLDIPYIWKKMEMRNRMGSPEFDQDGFGDLLLSTRWRFYRDTQYNHHAGVLLRVSAPTGDYRKEYQTRPGLQLGTGAVGLGTGLQYSGHRGPFWTHAGLEYFYTFENSDDYQFGDILRGGLALHYTPSTRTILGIEVDAMRKGKNTDDATPAGGGMGMAAASGTVGKVANTGRKVVTANLVLQQRIATFGGGNFNLRALFGMPLYQDVNAIQLGEAYHAMAAVQWKRRF